jgi:hypothetical protein
MANNHQGYHRLVLTYIKQYLNLVTLSLGKQRVRKSGLFKCEYAGQMSRPQRDICLSPLKPKSYKLPIA